MNTNDTASKVVEPLPIDWNADDNIGVIYRKRYPTVADYDEAISDLQNAREAIASGDESGGCAICTDGGHGVRTCHHNPLVQARLWATERGKWRCYHCDYVALTDEQAREHFGDRDDEIAACIAAQVRPTAAEIDRLTARNADFERTADLEREIAALRAALAPFGRECDDMGLGLHLTDERLIDEVDDAPSLLTVGDYRRARNALGGQP